MVSLNIYPRPIHPTLPADMLITYNLLISTSRTPPPNIFPTSWPNWKKAASLWTRPNFPDSRKALDPSLGGWWWWRRGSVMMGLVMTRGDRYLCSSRRSRGSIKQHHCCSFCWKAAILQLVYIWAWIAHASESAFPYCSSYFTIQKPQEVGERDTLHLDLLPKHFWWCLSGHH